MSKCTNDYTWNEVHAGDVGRSGGGCNGGDGGVWGRLASSPHVAASE